MIQLYFYIANERKNINLFELNEYFIPFKFWFLSKSIKFPTEYLNEWLPTKFFSCFLGWWDFQKELERLLFDYVLQNLYIFLRKTKQNALDWNHIYFHFSKYKQNIYFALFPKTSLSFFETKIYIPKITQHNRDKSRYDKKIYVTFFNRL